MTSDEILKAYAEGERSFSCAYLSGAYLREASLPAPTMVLMADWGTVSKPLCRQLMRYDASCHPRPSAFSAWAKVG